MDKLSIAKTLFESRQNAEKAEEMSRYMKDLFPFYGIPAPERKELYKDFLKQEKASKTIDWDFLKSCYGDEHREAQYLVYDYLLAMKKYVSYEDIDKIRFFIVNKSWWDTIDFLCKVIGDIGLRDKRVGRLMLAWSAEENIWIKRTAILFQLAYKNKTDTELLEKIIANCLGSEEFFVNKAIGWALREYAKTDSGWVKNFLERYNDKLSALSVKEAGKYI